jgi:hypothetical protein
VEQSNAATDPSDDTNDDTVGLSDEEIAERKLLASYATDIQSAKDTYEEVAIFMAPRGFEEMGIVIVAAPLNSKTYENLLNNLAKDQTDKAVELRNFAIQCTVFPKDRDAVKKMYVKRTPFALKAAARAQELAGSDTKELGKG